MKHLLLTELLLSVLVLLSPIAVGFAQTENNVCLGCHAKGAGKKGAVNQQGFENSVHGGLDCTACHEGVDPKKVPHGALSPVQCITCHSELQETFDQSIHGPSAEPIAACWNCHGSHEILPVQNPASQVSPANEPAACGVCHGQESDDYKRGRHFLLLARTDLKSPSCSRCHGSHGIKAIPEEKTWQANNVCIDCHLLGQQQVLNYIRVKPEFVLEYKNSAHGRENGRGEIAARCVDCHAAHHVGTHDDPESPLGRAHIADTCGKCHTQVAQLYKSSIHGAEMARGNTESATCTDCHGEHSIFPTSEPQAEIRGEPLATKRCGACHGSVRLSSKYGFSPERLSSYEASYHGLAVVGGSLRGADCASCHGYHEILPSSDPASKVHPRNLETTCGACHKGATERFARIPVHSGYDRDSNVVAFWVRVAYLWMIALTIGGMALHNIIIFAYYVRKKWQHEQSEPSYRRFVRFEVLQHTILLVSFTILVITGFALKFPSAFWVQGLQSLGWSEELRRIIHRIAAVFLMVSGVLQLIYFVLYRRGRREMLSLRPTIKDFTDFWHTMLFYLGRRERLPEYDRYDYTEKAEYLALIWGTAIMAGTGIVLWFPELILPWTPWWFFDVAQAVHYYEAWLATLAILVWHMFFVMLHPREYPISTVFLNGRMSENEWRERHYLEYERETRSAQEPEGDGKGE